MNWKAVIGTGVLLLLAGGGYAAYRYIKRQKELLQDYEIAIIGIKFSSFSEDLITIDFTLRVTNKADIEATVERLYADVYLNNAYVGNMINNGSFLVPARGTSDIKLQFSFASKELLKNLVNTLFTLVSTKDISYQIKGLVKLSSAGIGLSLPFDYTGFLKSDMLSTSVTSVVKNK